MKRVQISLTKTQKEWLKKKAEEKEISMAGLLRELVNEKMYAQKESNNNLDENDNQDSADLPFVD